MLKKMILITIVVIGSWNQIQSMDSSNTLSQYLLSSCSDTDYEYHSSSNDSSTDSSPNNSQPTTPPKNSEEKIQKEDCIIEITPFEKLIDRNLMESESTTVSINPQELSDFNVHFDSNNEVEEKEINEKICCTRLKNSSCITLQKESVLEKHKEKLAFALLLVGSQLIANFNPSPTFNMVPSIFSGSALATKFKNINWVMMVAIFTALSLSSSFLDGIAQENGLKCTLGTIFGAATFATLAYKISEAFKK